MRRNIRAGVAIVLSAMLLTTLGCTGERSIVSQESEALMTIDTLDMQRTWIGEQFDDTVAASGVIDGWFDIYNNEVFWAEDLQIERHMILGSLFPLSCGGHGGRLNEMLKNTTAEDPMRAAALVRAHWITEGWMISDIREFQEGVETYFRADHEDGAEMAFYASTEMMSMQISTRCSAHATVTGWQHFDNAESIHVKKLRELQDAAGIEWREAAVLAEAGKGKVHAEELAKSYGLEYVDGEVRVPDSASANENEAATDDEE